MHPIAWEAILVLPDYTKCTHKIWWINTHYKKLLFLIKIFFSLFKAFYMDANLSMNLKPVLTYHEKQRNVNVLQYMGIQSANCSL